MALPAGSGQEQVIADGKDAKAVAEAKQRIPILTELLAVE